MGSLCVASAAEQHDS